MAETTSITTKYVHVYIFTFVIVNSGWCECEFVVVKKEKTYYIYLSLSKTVKFPKKNYYHNYDKSVIMNSDKENIKN